MTFNGSSPGRTASFVRTASLNPSAIATRSQVIQTTCSPPDSSTSTVAVIGSHTRSETRAPKLPANDTGPGGVMSASAQPILSAASAGRQTIQNSVRQTYLMII